MKRSPVIMHAATYLSRSLDSLITFPQDCRMAKYDELRPHTAASDDTVKDTATPEPVVVTAESMVLKQQYPWSFSILVYE